MARAIYQQTMHRSQSRPAVDEDEMDSSESPPSEQPDSSRGGRPEGAPSFAGTRTTYTDRQVARRARARSKTRQIRNLKTLIAVLVMCLVLILMGWTFTWSELRILDSEALALDLDLRETGLELDKVRDRLSARDAEVAELVQNRIPGLAPIEYNKLLDINDNYLINITFSQSGTADDRSVEYHAMLQNDTAGLLLPRVSIYLFDEIGLQVAISKLEKTHVTAPVDFAELERGEIRSYHSQFTIERHSEPEYFRIQVE